MAHSARHHERLTARAERREALFARLAEAEETLQALREGQVDALVVRGAGGDQIYTLHGAEEPYRNLVEQMRQGALVLTPAGDILYANAPFAALVGQPLESVLGGHISRFLSDVDGADCAALLSCGSGTRRTRLVAGDGTTKEVHFSLTTTVSSKGVGNLSLIVTDLSELLEARSERDHAERQSHAKDEFLAMLAHELRNPLGAIRSALGVLEALGPTNVPATRPREVIARQVGYLSHLIDDLLDVERVATGKIRLERRPLDMAEMVERAVATVTGNTPPSSHLEISTEPVWVDGDAVRLQQVIANIVTNAVKYTPPGGRIQVSLRASGDDAVLSVADTGSGIPLELLPSIFDMFVQGDRTLDRAQGGLGIGLTLVRRLVDLHGGTVVATSGGAGRGSTFTVRLPRTPMVPSGAAVAASPDRAAPRRVLLIEDSRDAREMFRIMLELAGHTVFEAEDGARGLELLEIEHPEVAVIDIGLPDLDGYAVARRIRAQPNGRAMLLVALTGYGFPSDYERSAEAGFDHHLVKPVDLDKFERLLARGAPSGVEAQA